MVKIRTFNSFKQLFLCHILLFSLSLMLHAQAPSNDSPCNAIELFNTPNCNSPLTFSNVNATTTAANGYVVTGCASTTTPKDVWFKVKTSNNGSNNDTKFTVTATGAPIGQIRVFYANTCAGPFSEIAQACQSSGNTTQCIVTNAQANTTYYVLLAGYWDNTPTGSFNVCVTPPPFSGCTNPLAVNYKPNATFDDGSCVFSASPISTCSFYSSNPNTLINNNLVVSDVITLSLGANKVLTDLDIVIKLNHSFLDDLDVLLTSPSGTTVELFKNICGGFDNMEIRFDDESYPLICGNPTKGFYRLPLNKLSAFDNEPTDGNWTIKIIDMSPGNNGLLTQWCLIPETKTVTCFPPFALKANNITTTSVDLDWTTPNNPVENAWNIELGLRNFSPTGIATKVATAKPYTYTGLLPNTTYDYYVQSKCLTNLGSSWSGPYTFTTAIPNGQCNLNVLVPDNQCSNANNYLVNVQNAGGTQLGKNIQIEEVRVILEHDWVSDLNLYLTSPNGKTVELSTKNGGTGDNYGNPQALNCSKYTSFVRNDCAAIPIVDADAPFIGKFYPEGNLNDFHDMSNPNGNWTFRICDVIGSNTGRIKYLELVFSNNNCAQVRNVVLSNILDKSLTINYLSQNSTCNKVVVEYGGNGFTPGNGVTGGVGGVVKTFACPVTLPLTITGLTPLQNYDFYIREECSPNVFAPNSCSVSAQMNCSTAALTLSDNFDNQNNCNTVCGDTCAVAGNWHNVRNDDFDWLINGGTTATTNTGPDNDVTGNGKYLYIEAGVDATCQYGKKAFLMSDCIKINTTADSCAMSFFYHAYGDDINKLALEISTDGGGNWTELWSVAGNQGNRWNRQYIDLQTFKNKIVQFRFVGLGGFGLKADLAIDQIEFYGSTNVGVASMSYYRDADADGYGDAASAIAGCAAIAPNGYVFNSLDCDDTNPTINPIAIEIPCNKIDENCNGLADDVILPSPLAQHDSICTGTFATLKAVGTPKGQYYWYETANSTQILAIGNTFATPILTADKTYFVQDSIVVKPGLRISEINLGNIDAVEIQNIGAAADYTGWSVVLGNASLQPFSVAWNLGNFNANEIQYRTRNTGNNYFGTNFNWNLGAKGFALILDNQGVAQDFVLFNTSQNDLNALNFSFNGKNYNKQNLPFKGDGVNPSLCGINQTINLIAANGENNNASDYEACATNTIGSQNAFPVNLDYFCQSLRVPVKALVQPYPLLQIPNLAEVCAGKNIDVRNIIVNDANNTQGVYSYHTASPASDNNLLISNTLSPMSNFNLVIKKTSIIGCTSEKTTTIKVNDLPLASITSSSTQPLCSGQTKILTGAYSGGVAPVMYEWSSGAVMQSIQVGNSFPSVNGIYMLTITDVKGCSDSTMIDVFNGSGITSASIVNIKDVSSCSGNDGEITLKPIDGTPPYKYTWSGPVSGNVPNVANNNNFKIFNLSKGTYSVTITDSSPLACDLVIPFLVVKSPDVNVKVDSVWAISCKGKNDGKIFLNSLSGQPYNYLWSNNKTTQNIDNLSVGNYSVTISSSACSQVLQNIVITEPDSLGLLSAIPANVSCTANGKINITPKGGTPPYAYFWNNGTTVQDLTNISVGSYIVTVSDARNCKFVSSPISLQSAPSLAINSVVFPAKCFNTATGKIDLTVTGGGRPYTYKWNNAATSEDLNNVLAGNYKISVTDANGCQVVSNTIAVGQAPKLVVIPQIVPPTCKGFSNGAIQLQTSGGTPTYIYEWNIGGAQNAVNQLLEGVYKATVTDGNACKVVFDSIKVTAPQVLNLSVAQIQAATCVGKKDGKIGLSINGGTLPYSYNWSNNATSQDLINTVTGSYSVTVSDQKGCNSILQNLIVGGAQAMSVKKDSLVQPTCFDFSDGKIFFEPKNGQTPYTFKWSNNTFNPNLFNLKSGTYTITVSDQNACEFYKTYQLLQPNPIKIVLNSIDSITCYGAEDAAIDISVTGGTPPFKFFWNSGQNNEDLSGVVAGDYKVTALDKNQCATTSEEIVIPVAQPLSIALETSNISKCNGTAFGSLDITVKGGRAPYQYKWSNGLTIEDPIGVASGTYSVTVTDKNNCKALLNAITILSPLQQLRIDTMLVKPITCNNMQDGRIEAKILGGEAPFAYNWSVLGIQNFKSQRADTITTLAEGLYVLTVTDSRGCTSVSDTFELQNPNAIDIFIDELKSPACKNTSTGYILTTISGGTSPYTYIWSGGKTTEDVVNVPAGLYILTVSDAKNCKKVSKTYSLNEPGDNVKIVVDSIHNVSCKGGNDGDIFLETQFGSQPFSYKWSNGTITNKGHLPALPSGGYTVTVTDGLGCTSKTNFIIVPEPQAIGLLVDTVKLNKCKDVNTAAIYVTALGGVPPYNFLWSDGKTNEDIFNLPNGFYKTTITDVNKCKFISNDISITSPDSLKISITTTIATMGLNNGTATANVSGGKTPYIYNWNNGEQTQTVTNLAPGKYEVIVTDANQCLVVKKSIIVGTTATQDAEIQPIIKIYPNPTTGILYIDYEFFDGLENNTQLDVFDFLGKKILTRPLTATAEKIELDLNDLSCGVYIVSFRNKGKMIGMKRVVVCR